MCYTTLSYHRALSDTEQVHEDKYFQLPVTTSHTTLTYVNTHSLTNSIGCKELLNWVRVLSVLQHGNTFISVVSICAVRSNRRLPSNN